MGTFTIERDLTTQLHAFARLLTRTRAGRVMAELIGAAQTDPELAAALLTHYTGPRRALAVETMRRPQSRGQLRPDLDPEVVVDQVWGACCSCRTCRSPRSSPPIWCANLMHGIAR